MDIPSYILGTKSSGGGGGGGSKIPRRIIVVENGEINTTANRETLQAIYNDYINNKIEFDGIYLKDVSQDYSQEPVYYALSYIHADSQAMQLKFYDTNITNQNTQIIQVGCNVYNSEVNYVVLLKQNIGVANGEITIDIQNSSSASLLDEVSKTITNNKDKILKVYVKDGSLFMSEGYIQVINTNNNYTPVASYTGNFGDTYTTVQINGSWNVGRTEYTASSIQTTTLNINKSLAVNNTTAFIPTGNYNPATKKYVDDQVGAINTVLATLTTPSNNGGE